MPAPQLPWFRFWKGATQHGKVRALSDAEFRTWVELLDLAAQQKPRGRFDSRKSAAALSRRPDRHIGSLVKAGLIDIDSSDEHLTMHDWDEWQRWRKEDLHDDGTPPDLPPNGLAISTRTTLERPGDQHENDSRTTTDQHTNDHGINTRTTTGSTHEQHTNELPPLTLSPGEERREKRDTPPLISPTRGSERKEVPKPKPTRTPITDDDIEELVGKYAERYGGRQAVRDEIEAALNHTARFKSLRERLYVDTWLRRELEHRPGGLRVLRGGTPSRTPIDRTGVAN